MIYLSSLLQKNPTYKYAVDRLFAALYSAGVEYQLVDGMVRFVDENTVIGNCVPSKNGLEQRIKSALQKYGIGVIDFPYFSSSNDSAVGCYLNFLETERYIFLPVFENAMDDKAIAAAEEIFSKKIVPININEIAKEGGVLNCISWETKQTEKIQKIKSEKSLRPEDNFMKPALHV